MAWMIGVDEAGYGPNLGPLVVAATAWRHDLAPSATTNVSPTDIDLYDVLSEVVSLSRDERRIAIADSKRLYQPGKGLRHLERGVHVACAAVRRDQCGGFGNSREGFGGAPPKAASVDAGQHDRDRNQTPAHWWVPPQTPRNSSTPGLCGWSELLDFLQADPENRRAALPWHDGFECPLPIDAARGEIDDLGELFYAKCEFAGVRPVAMRARLVFPAEFNDAVHHLGSKGAALSRITLSLVREICDEIEPRRSQDDGPIQVVCDKHGGRNKYGTIIRNHFPEYHIRALVEGLEESRYRCKVSKMFAAGPAKLGDVDFTFRTHGEMFLPAALASMIAKYLRELAMRAENEFWAARVEDLRPTAGYPIDAHRFKSDIAEAQTALAIDDHILWRVR